MAAKTPTPQGISALLKRAGFKRSEDHAGGFNWSSGYRVGKHHGREGAVWVRHQFWSMADGDAKPYLTKYAEAITAAGWNVETSERDLIVTVKEG